MGKSNATSMGGFSVLRPTDASEPTGASGFANSRARGLTGFAPRLAWVQRPARGLMPARAASPAGFPARAARHPLVRWPLAPQTRDKRKRPPPQSASAAGRRTRAAGNDLFPILKRSAGGCSAPRTIPAASVASNDANHGCAPRPSYDPPSAGLGSCMLPCAQSTRFRVPCAQQRPQSRRVLHNAPAAATMRSGQLWHSLTESAKHLYRIATDRICTFAGRAGRSRPDAVEG